MIFSDGLDVEKIEELYARFVGRVKVSPGWGTQLTNDFAAWCRAMRWLFSLVCKAVSANGRPTVKLSDNPNKAMGPKVRIERCKRSLASVIRWRRRWWSRRPSSAPGR
ncbi:MAG: hypothetical protein R3D63_12315 [Paracoccaceae bacterium]